MNEVEPAVLSMSRGLSLQNALEDRQNGGKGAATCKTTLGRGYGGKRKPLSNVIVWDCSSVAEIIYRNSFIYFENGLIYVSKEIKGKSYRISQISTK